MQIEKIFLKPYEISIEIYLRHLFVQVTTSQRLPNLLSYLGLELKLKREQFLEQQRSREYKMKNRINKPTSPEVNRKDEDEVDELST